MRVLFPVMPYIICYNLVLISLMNGDYGSIFNFSVPVIFRIVIYIITDSGESIMQFTFVMAH